MHQYNTFDLVRLRGKANRTRQDYWLLSMADRYGDEMVPSIAYMHVPLESGAPWFFMLCVLRLTIDLQTISTTPIYR